jgi:hypothetical protein
MKNHLTFGTFLLNSQIPTSHISFQETLARLQKPSSSVDVTPSIRVICRELAPVGGISMKEHFEGSSTEQHLMI